MGMRFIVFKREFYSTADLLFTQCIITCGLEELVVIILAIFYVH